MIYVDLKEKKKKKDEVYNNCSSTQDPRSFGNVMKKLDSVYNIFDIVYKNFNYASKRFELADDNRRVKLRVNTQFHDVVDEATQE